MRILAVTPYYSPEGGGLERYAHAILSRLGARGHSVKVLTFGREAVGRQVIDGVVVERRRPLMRVGNAPIGPGFAGTVARSIAAMRPQVVVAHTPVPFPAEMAYRASQRAGVPFVVTYHAGRLRGSSAPLNALAALDRWTLERRMLAGAARLVAVSPYVRDTALRRHADRVVVVPPGVDAGAFRSVEPSGDPNILFVGPLARSHRWKGVDVLWEAFGQVRERLPEATLTLVGTGDRFREFYRKAVQAGGPVRLVGRAGEEDLVREYQRAAVVVLPSITDAESFGMVLAEANACGRPVVASRVGGIPSFVEEGRNGALARPGDAGDLARALLGVLTRPDEARQMGRRGRALVVRNHDWDDLAAATERVLVQAADDSVPRATGAARSGSATRASLQRGPA